MHQKYNQSAEKKKVLVFLTWITVDALFLHNPA